MSRLGENAAITIGPIGHIGVPLKLRVSFPTSVRFSQLLALKRRHVAVEDLQHEGGECGTINR